MRARRTSALLAGAAVAAAVSAPGAARAATPLAQPPSAEVRAFLAAMDPARVSATVSRLAAFGTRQTLSSTTDPVRGIGAARDWITQQLQATSAATGGRLQVRQQTFVQPRSSDPDDRVPRDTQMTNVIATLPGSDPVQGRRVYVVSAHYDSRCTGDVDAACDAPGADDDASGVAAVLEMARAMAPHRFDATIMFVAVPGEEEGLYGSAHLAKDLKRRGVDVAGMLNNDIIGSATGSRGQRAPFRVRLFSEGTPTTETAAQRAIRQSVGGDDDAPARQLARFVKDVGEGSATGMTVDLVARRDRYLRGGDQVSFLEQGFPAVRFTEPFEVYAHQHQDVRVEDGTQFGDLPQYVDAAYATRVARVNAAALAALADAPRQPRGVTIDTSDLSEDTVVRWRANRDPDVARYEVVTRPTTSPVWTTTADAGRHRTLTLRRSKDDVFVGVRAVDRDGHASPVTFALPSE